MIKPLPIVAATASASAAGYSPLYVANDYAGVVWRSNGGASAYLVLDLGADMAVDTVALFGLSGFTGASTLNILIATAAQGSGFAGGAYATFVAGAAALAGSVMPVNDRGIGIFSTNSPVTGRYLRIELPGGTIEIARAVIGKRIQLERNFSYGGAFGVRDLGSLDFSARGVLLRRRARKLRTVGLTFSNINKDEVENITKPLLEQIGNTEMIALITDPSADPQRQNRSYYGPLVGDLAHTWRNARAFEARVNLVSIF